MELDFQKQNLSLQLLLTSCSHQKCFSFSFLLPKRPQYFSVWSHQIGLASISNRMIYYCLKLLPGLIQSLQFFQTWINGYMSMDLLFFINLRAFCCGILSHYHLSATFERIRCYVFSQGSSNDIYMFHGPYIVSFIQLYLSSQDVSFNSLRYPSWL